MFLCHLFYSLFRHGLNVNFPLWIFYQGKIKLSDAFSENKRICSERYMGCLTRWDESNDEKNH